MSTLSKKVICGRIGVAIANGCLVGIATLPLTAWAVPFKEVPNPRQQNKGWVTDMANVLSPETEDNLNQMITALEAENGSEIAVVTVPETSPSASPKAFATSLFNHWGIGKKEQDNGVLFLISKGDRRVEIETGYGVEAILPDAKVGQIIDNHILPKFKTGNFDQGATTGTLILAGYLTSDTASSQPVVKLLDDYEETPDFSWVFWVLGLGGLIGGMGFLSLRKTGAILRPGQRSRVSREKYSADLSGRTPRCTHCQKNLNKVDSEILSAHLTDTEKAAQKLGSVKFVGWQCPTFCQEDKSKDVHIRAYIWNPISFRECPECQEFTVKYSSETLEEPTDSEVGKVHATEMCVCCDFYQEYDETTPRLKSVYSHHHNSSYTSSGYGGYSGGGLQWRGFQWWQRRQRWRWIWWG